MQKNEHAREIKAELYRAFVLLGADNGLLGALGSWGDSLPGGDVLENLRGWNEATLQETRGRIEHYEMSSRRPAYNQDEGQKTA